MPKCILEIATFLIRANGLDLSSDISLQLSRDFTALATAKLLPSEGEKCESLISFLPLHIREIAIMDGFGNLELA